MSISFREYSMESSSRCGNFDGEKIDGSNSVLFGGGVRRSGGGVWRSGDNDESEDSDKAGEGTLDEGA